MTKPQPELTLYHFPGACSEVAVCALEAAGLSYKLELVNLAAGEQNGAAYKAVNPLGKVPYLLVDGAGLAENAAILTYIAALRPEAGLFPASDDPRLRAEAIGGMSFVGGTLHPTVRGIVNPQRITNGDLDGVRSKSTEIADKSFGEAERRLAARGWWLGERSIVDVYLVWVLSAALRAGYDAGKFPNLRALAGRLAEYPAFVRMQAINAEARKTLGL